MDSASRGPPSVAASSRGASRRALSAHGGSGGGRGLSGAARGRGRGRAASAGAEEPVVKRAKQFGVCKCSACGVKSDKAGEPAWPHQAPHPRSGQMVNFDDKCAKCWKRFGKGGFHMYLSWPEYCEYSRKDDSKEALAEVDKNLESQPEVLNYRQHGVEAEHSSGWMVKKDFMALDKTEFRSKMDGEPHSKMPACPSVDVRREGSNEEETFWLFEHPQTPFRTLSYFSKFNASDTAQHLAPPMHLAEGMNAHAMMKVLEAANTDSGFATVSGSVKFPELDTFKRAFATERAKSAAAAAEKRELRKQSSLGDGDEQARPTTFVENGEEKPIEDVPLVPVGSPSAGAASSATSPAARTAAPEGVAAALDAQHRSRSPRPRVRSCVGGDDGDGRSVISDGCTEAGGSATKSAQRGHDVGYYTRVLNLQQVVDGEKLGVQEHHARVLLTSSKLSTVDRDTLHNHLELIDQAKKLADENLEFLLPDAFNKAVDLVILGCKIEPSAALEMSAFKIRAKELHKFTHTEYGLRAYLKCLRPWTDPSDKTLDLKLPILGCSRVPPKEKASLFTNSLATTLLNPLVKKGESGREWLVQATKIITEF